MLNTKNDIQILLFGYNRLEKLLDRINEIQELQAPNVYVSVDFLDEETSLLFRNELTRIERSWPINEGFAWDIKKENLGLTRHLTSTISEALGNFSGVIVIEDDVLITKQFYNAAKRYLESKKLQDEYIAFSGFSPIPNFQKLDGFNRFRTTQYFACWGWAISKENWIAYSYDISNEDIEAELEQSPLWKSLSETMKKTWLTRFHKVQLNPGKTWDIQFQYYLFKKNMPVLSPIFRLVENDGFSDSRSTHTIDRRPRVLGKLKTSNHDLDGRVAPIFISKLINRLESVFFYEDRSILRKIRTLKTLFYWNRNPS